MFYDIGRKLQKLALVIFWVIVAMSVIYPVVIVILAGGGGGLIFLTIIVCGAIGVLNQIFACERAMHFRLRRVII